MLMSAERKGVSCFGAMVMRVGGLQGPAVGGWRWLALAARDDGNLAVVTLLLRAGGARFIRWKPCHVHCRCIP